ncbi:MAG: Phthiodiolone/phenolphthiodiolone dimycocerosates ketoreductase, partial [Frankiales bacterium]|nr:Phthiodiolone/phenolphthiodiolone dimycocerosates ketoreductase [Frankiales bacterium]
ILVLGSQIKPHIERRFSLPCSAPAARMAEFVRAMRAIWHTWESGEPLDFTGEFYRHTLMTPMFTPPSTLPAPKIFLAAVGDKMTQTAGAVADGMLIHPFSTESYVREVTVPALERSRAASELAGQPLDIVSSAFVVTGRTDAERAQSAASVRRQIAFYGSTPAYRPVFEHHGWGELGTELNALSKSTDPDRWEQMGSLIHDEALSAFAVVATPDEVGSALAGRWGDLITRYEVNHVGIEDTGLQLEVAQGIRTAMGA